MFKKTVFVTTCALLATALPAAWGQHRHGEGHEHAPAVKFVMPTAYEDAVHEILHRLDEIEQLIEFRQLDQVHPQADVIRKVGNVIGQLALKPDSGVSKKNVKEINKAGRALAAKFDAIDKAGDSGDVSGTQREYNEMVKLAATLEKYLPKYFACPMKCEGDKMYSAEGKCPKCGMNLTEVKAHRDHEAKHGGIFFMAPDQKHHLEATVSAKGEFRIYFYDKFTKPIHADKFTAEGKVWKKGAKEADGRPLKLSLGHEEAFLTGRIHASVYAPLSARVYIDFKDGKKPQLFDFDFDEPSKEPEEHGSHEEHEEHDGREKHGEHDGHGH